MKGYLRSSFRKYGVILCFLDPIWSLYKFRWKSQSLKLQSSRSNGIKLRFQILVLGSDNSHGKDFLQVQYILGSWSELGELKVIKNINIKVSFQYYILHLTNMRSLTTDFEHFSSSLPHWPKYCDFSKWKCSWNSCSSLTLLHHVI